MNITHNIRNIALAAAVAVGSVAAGSLATVGAAHAAAPMVKTSAPGFYRMMLGDFEVTALSDGTADLPVDKLLTNTTPAKVKSALAKSFLTAPLETSFNGYLINTGTKLVLIDTGAAKLFGPTLGNLVANLKASGYQPEQVDERIRREVVARRADEEGQRVDAEPVLAEVLPDPGVVDRGQVVLGQGLGRVDRPLLDLLRERTEEQQLARARDRQNEVRVVASEHVSVVGDLDGPGDGPVQDGGEVDH